MNEHVQDAEAVFLSALEKGTPAERVAYIEATCEGNVDLLLRVRELLASHDQSRGPLDSPPPGLAGTMEMPTTSERPGTIIGPYKLLQQIGEGGMGVVYMAEQTQPVHRKVALKIIKPGMDSKQVIARFEAERQALAMMDHVNIARVIDGGTTESGRPYFVMELINGVPITKYCDDNHLTPRERLELFVPVCAAIQHAHQKGIIHRDIKPSNVLVTIYEGKPVPKVIDFGVAKAIDQKLTEHTLCTNFGIMVGTLEYMSPEQAEMSALGVDTRSDIYSLGVLLYELLTGSTPLTKQRLKAAANLEILRLIKEEEPQKPSTRLSESGEALASISAMRKTELAKLSRLVRGELDWIVMKTLEKDCNRRYETANGLGRDIQRYLADESVEACPPSLGYRMRKFVRRNKGVVVAASLILLTLVAGIIGTTYGLIQADQQRMKAEKAEADTLEEFQASTDDAIQKLIGSKPALGEQEKEYLENTLKRWQRFAARTGNDERSRAIRAEGHHRVGRLWFRLGRVDEAIKEYKVARDLRIQLLADFPNTPEYRFALARTRNDLGTFLGNSEERIEYEAALDLWKQLAVESPSEPKYLSGLADTHTNLGNVLHGLGRNDQALKEYEIARDLRKKVATEFPSVPEFEVQKANTHNALGAMYRFLGRTAEARIEHEAAREINKKLIASHPGVLKYRTGLACTQNTLGILLSTIGELNDASKEYEAACV